MSYNPITINEQGTGTIADGLMAEHPGCAKNFTQAAGETDTPCDAVNCDRLAPHLLGDKRFCDDCCSEIEYMISLDQSDTQWQPFDYFIAGYWVFGLIFWIVVIGYFFIPDTPT